MELRFGQFFCGHGVDSPEEVQGLRPRELPLIRILRLIPLVFLCVFLLLCGRLLLCACLLL